MAVKYPEKVMILCWKVIDMNACVLHIQSPPSVKKTVPFICETEYLMHSSSKFRLFLRKLLRPKADVDYLLPISDEIIKIIKYSYPIHLKNSLNMHLKVKVDNNNTKSMQQKKKKIDTIRSKLSKASFIKWLRTRYRNENRKNNSYLYFPQELVKETSIEQIFHDFDFDDSGGLSRDEVFEMFNGYGIPITMEDLNKLYDSVQVNLEEMDCDMFKRCALSQKSNRVFSEIIKSLGEGYMPHNFTSMIIYLVYLSKRQEIKTKIEKQKISIKEKIENVENLLKLKDLIHNNQRLNIHADNFKQNLRNKFRDIWEKVNQSYGQKFPYTGKLEQQFYEYYKANSKMKGTI